jgi:hypothetical protein
MKILKNGMFVLSYIFQYIIPIVLFGGVIPYTHGELGAGLTGCGVIAACIILALIYRKIKAIIKDKLTGVAQELLLSLFPIAMWVTVGKGIYGVMNFINSLIDYWWVALIFIILGRVCAIVGKALKE